MCMTPTDPYAPVRARWADAVVALGATLTVAIAAFIGAVELTLRVGGVRPAAAAGVVIAVAMLALPGRWRWLTLAWCIGLASFGAFWLALASAPNYGDLLP